MKISQEVMEHFAQYEGTETSLHGSDIILSIDVRKDYPREMWEKYKMFPTRMFALDWDDNDVLCEWYEIELCPFADCEECQCGTCDIK